MDVANDDIVEMSREEMIELAAEDSEFYCRQFFPKTVRQPFADFHYDGWDKLESESRLVNLLMFRGAGKTSHCRLYTSKAIAFAMSRTILYVGKSEGHAVRSTAWIKKNVENNSLWTQTFQIRQGQKWQDTEFEIIVGPPKEEISIWIMAAGIEGSIRGLNRDDYRPDLIVLDDVLDDENAHTPERREKINRLVYGALLESLAPKSESPHAKMIALNTPQHKEDFAVQALKDPTWLSAVYGCFTRQTANMPLKNQKSSWPMRFTDEELQQEKQAAFNRNMISVFLREKECKLVSAETSSFQIAWLNKYNMPPSSVVPVYAIDPVPPPSDQALSKGLHRNDFEAHVVWGAYGNKRLLLDYRIMRGHEPTWTIATFFELQRKWHPIKTLVESVAYQRTLLFLLKEAMTSQREWYAIQEYQDKRKKFNRILSTLNPIASSRNMYVREEHVEFLEQFAQYPDVSNDDILDASAIALEDLQGIFVTDDGEMKHITDLGQSASDSGYKPLTLGRAP